MAISYINGGANSSNNGNSFSITTSGWGLQQYDVLIAFGAHPTQATDPKPSGWTTIGSPLNSGTTLRVCVSYLVCTSSPPSSVTFPGDGNAASGVSGLVMAFRGLDPSVVSDLTPTTAVGASGAPNNPSITPATNGAAVLALAASTLIDTTPGANTNYLPATAIRDAGNDNNDTQVMGQYRLDRTGGVAEDPDGYSAQGSAVWAAITVALRPQTVFALNATALAGASPVFASAGVGQKHVLTGTPIVGSDAVVPAATFSEKNALSASSFIAGVPSFGTAHAWVTSPNTVGAQIWALGEAAIGEGAPPALVTSENYELTANAIAAGAAAFGTATVAQKHVLTATEIATGSPTFGTAVIGVNLTATAISGGAPAFGTATVAQKHVLVGSALLTGPPALGTPAAAQQWVDLILSTDVLDNGLNELEDADVLHVCTDNPVDYTDLGTLSIGSKDVGVGNLFGAPEAAADGRKITSAPIVSGDITANGIVSRWAAVDSVGERILATGNIDAPEAVTSGSQFNLASFTIRSPVGP